MKKNLSIFLILLLLLIFKINAQSIISFNIIPSQPTTADSITIIIENMFTSGGCDGSAALTGINGNSISAEGIHCMGMLTVICTDYDTITIPPLVAGTYSFNFTLLTETGFPCAPGSIPLDFDSATFTVTDLTGIYYKDPEISLQLIPNPSSGNFVVKHSGENESTLKFYSVDGRLLNTHEFKKAQTEINCSLPPGVHIAVYENKYRRNISKLVIEK